MFNLKSYKKPDTKHSLVANRNKEDKIKIKNENKINKTIPNIILTSPSGHEIGLVTSTPIKNGSNWNSEISPILPENESKPVFNFDYENDKIDFDKLHVNQNKRNEPNVKKMTEKNNNSNKDF